MDIIDKPILSDEELAKLNNKIKEIIQEKNNSNMDFNFYEEIFGFFVRKVKKFKEKNFYIVSELKKSEMIKIALDFFQSLGSKYYENVKKVILNTNENVEINFVNVNKTNTDKRRANVHTEMGKSSVYIPYQDDIPKEMNLDDDICTFQDLYALVHENGHLLDKNDDLSLPIVDYFTKPKLRYKENKTRNLFTETTAILFETLLTEYLLKETSYSKEVVIDTYNSRQNLLFRSMSRTYSILLLAKEIEKNGELTQIDVQNYIKEINVNERFFDYIAHEIINLKNEDTIEVTIEYLIGTIVTPTIVHKYHEDGIEAIDKYIKLLKENNLEGVVDYLGISFENDESYEQVLNNIFEERNLINNVLAIPTDNGKKATKEVSEDDMER